MSNLNDKTAVYEALKTVHSDIWRRFIRRPYGILLDYADACGNVIYPTPGDCEKSMPNGLAWWTPVENGAFFTGLYLSGLINRAESSGRDAYGTGTEDEILTLTRGLFKLQDVGAADGFIARGMADDGEAHYPCGSEDQTAPWIYGLWRLYRSGYAADSLKSEIRERIMRVINALAANNWRVPSEWGGVTAGDFSEFNMRNASRLLFICRIAVELDADGKNNWMEKYRALASEKNTENEYNRLDICSEGLGAEMTAVPGLNGQFWIYLCAQASLRELCLLENDETFLSKFRRGLAAGGVKALEAVPRLLQNYRLSETRGGKFDIDWRPLARFWREHKTRGEACDIASVQAAYWNKNIVPRRSAEHGLLVQAIFALWTAKLSPDADAPHKAEQILDEILTDIDFTKLYLPAGFSAESAYYEMPSPGGESYMKQLK